MLTYHLTSDAFPSIFPYGLASEGSSAFGSDDAYEQPPTWDLPRGNSRASLPEKRPVKNLDKE